MPIHVAIVEDDSAEAKKLSDAILRYAEEHRVSFRITRFEDAVSLLDHYTAAYDIIFMDISLPYMSGMDAAHRLRALDQTAILIFVTNLTQYAVEGYEVGALCYIVKPVNDYDLAMKLSRAVGKVPAARRAVLEFGAKGSTFRLDPDEIVYVESRGHHLTFHTRGGEYTQYSSLSKLETKLPKDRFARCNSCYLVNLDCVRAIKGYTAFLDGWALKISQPRKKAFVRALEDYLASHPEKSPMHEGPPDAGKR